MLRWYRGLSTSTRLLAYAGLLALSLAIAFTRDANLLLVFALVAAGALLLDAVIYRTRLFLAGVVAAAQLILAYLIAAQILADTARAAGELNGEAYLYAYTSMSLLLLFLLVHILVAVRLMRGRVWVNLLVLSALTDATLFGFVVLLQTADTALPLPFLLAGAASVLYVLLRSIRWRRVERQQPYSVSNRKLHWAEDHMGALGLQVQVLEGDYLRLIGQDAQHPGVVYAVFPLHSTQDVTHTSEGFFVDGEDRTHYLEDFLAEVSAWRRQAKLPQARVLPILWNVRPGPRWARRVRVYTRKRPDVMLGQLYFLNNDGFRWLLGAAGRPSRLSGRTRRRLEAAFAQPTLA